MLPTDENEVSSAEEDVIEKKGKGKQSAKTKKSPPTFEELAKDHGLKDTTLAILIENDYDSKEAVAFINEDDMAELKLTLGQSGMLKKWVATDENKTLQEVNISTTPSDNSTINISTIDIGLLICQPHTGGGKITAGQLVTTRG